MHPFREIRSLWLDLPRRRLFEGAAVTVGSFDGIHLGHRALVEEVVRIGEERHLPPVVVAFDPHPRIVLGQRVDLLTTPQERELLLRRIGASCVVHIRFTKAIAEMSHRRFVSDFIVGSLGAKVVVVGYDHHFGKGRRGNVESLRALGEELGFDVVVVPPVEVGGIVAKSSTIRRLISEGKVDEAGRLLGHPYLVLGRIVPGRGLGRRIGYPTANVDVPPGKLLPPNGVYAAWAVLMPDEEPFPAALYIGSAPTFGAGRRTLEAHLLGFGGERLYGKRIALEIMAFVRSEVRFPSPEALAAQIADDLERVEDLISSTAPTAAGRRLLAPKAAPPEGM